MNPVLLFLLLSSSFPVHQSECTLWMAALVHVWVGPYYCSSILYTRWQLWSNKFIYWVEDTCIWVVNLDMLEQIRDLVAGDLLMFWVPRIKFPFEFWINWRSWPFVRLLFRSAGTVNSNEQVLYPFCFYFFVCSLVPALRQGCTWRGWVSLPVGKIQFIQHSENVNTSLCQPHKCTKLSVCH